ncbi:hypothetical protein [Streptosporangium longisporum]|uniref:DNA-binding protein n=1 Tax=Streptosporangium longisporum TaxID=46187 RepID=A0ABN3Y9K4_9ACTN
MASASGEQSESDIPVAIGRPARGALAAAGYDTLAQVATATEKELLALHGMGPKALGLLRATLAERGLTFAGAGRDAT